MIDRLQNINTINYKSIQKDQNQVGFKGVFSSKIVNLAGKFETNPILELLVIDLCGMVIPRTLIDLNRNKKDLGGLNWDAGRETGIRELSTAFILYFLPGLAAYGLGNTLLKSRLINKEGLDTKFMRFSFLNAAHEHFGIENLKTSENTLKNKDDILTFKKKLIGQLFEKARPEIRDVENMPNGFNKLKDDFITELTKINDVNVQKNFSRKLAGYLKEASLKIVYQGEKKEKKLVTSTGHFIRDLNDISVTLLENALKNARDAKGNIKEADFANHYIKLTKQIKMLKYAKLALGVGAGMISLVAFPKLNIWISKKVSHKENFPGTNGLIEHEQTKAKEVRR